MDVLLQACALIAVAIASYDRGYTNGVSASVSVQVLNDALAKQAKGDSE